MKLALTIIRIVFTWPALLVGWLFVALSLVLLLAKKPRLDKETLVLEATWRPWFAKRWKYSTTICRGIIYRQEDPSLRIQQHEHTHVEQVEDLLLLAFVLSLMMGIKTGDFWWYLGIHMSGVAWQLPSFLGAVLRGKHVYRGSGHEEHAYALTNIIGQEHAGKSWKQVFEEEKRGF